MGSRSNKQRHPCLQDWAVGEWCPDAVGKVRGYPKTAEAYEARKAQLAENTKTARARGRLTRRGVPNGYGGERRELTLIRENARCNAERVMERVTDRVPDDLAKFAMSHLLEIVFDPTVPVSERLTAAKTALMYLVPMPVAQAIQAEDPITWLTRL